MKLSLCWAVSGFFLPWFALLVLMRHFDPGFGTPGLSVQYSLAAAHDRWSANVLGLLNARFVEHAPAAQLKSIILQSPTV